MLQNINSIIWAIVTSLIILMGFYFSKKLSFPQFNVKKIIKSLKVNNKDGISPIKTLYLTLAGRIGVGSIAGVALAIYIGGPGTIFWMWVTSLISGSLAYTETLLGIKYKNGSNYGGPSYYIYKGLNNKLLASIYSLIVIIAYLTGFIPIQSNTIVKSSNMFLDINHGLIGLLLGLVTFLIVSGGINKIANVTNRLVPFMTIIYIMMSLFAILSNLDKFIDIIILIIKSAFSFNSFFSGFMVTMLIGVQRGIFSNESGLGLGAIAASSSNSDNGCNSGYIQVLGIYITTILICTATAFMILTFDYGGLDINSPNGIEITSLAFNYHFGGYSNILLVLCILLFSFTTILTGYYYCESSLKFLMGRIDLKWLRLVVPLSVFLGCVCSPKIIWSLVDIMVGILAIINIYALYKLRDKAFKYHKKCDRI